MDESDVLMRSVIETSCAVPHSAHQQPDVMVINKLPGVGAAQKLLPHRVAARVAHEVLQHRVHALRLRRAAVCAP